VSQRACRQPAKLKYGEGYRLLQRAMVGVREDPIPSEVRPLCLAADWLHLKLLLYAIGSGTVTNDNMQALHQQWTAHLRTFGPELGVHRTCLDGK
jgi:hypothetical protein